jgi:hypothetical protein
LILSKQVYEQVKLLTNGNVDIWTSDELDPMFAPYQHTSSQINSDCSFNLAHSCEQLKTLILHIDDKYKSSITEDYPIVPNYLAMCGGAADIDRVLASSTSTAYFSNNAIYHPLTFVKPLFNLSKKTQQIKDVLNMVLSFLHLKKNI